MSISRGKYVTQEQKDLRHNIDRLNKRMAVLRKRYLNTDVMKSEGINQLRRLGIEYKRR